MIPYSYEVEYDKKLYILNNTNILTYLINDTLFLIYYLEKICAFHLKN
jgi:hypothetical protein